MDQNQEQNSPATEPVADDASAIMQLAEKADTGVTAETVDQPQPEATQPKEEAAKTPAPVAAVSPQAEETKQDEAEAPKEKEELEAEVVALPERMEPPCPPPPPMDWRRMP